MKQIRVCIALAVFLCMAPAAPAQTSLQGVWEGSILLPGMQLGISVKFIPSGDTLRATIDIPQQGAMGLALKNVSFAAPKVHFELPAGPGLAVFEGTLRADSIAGDFKQSGITARFGLARAVTSGEAKAEILPYKEEEVVFHNGDVSLAGTLTLPAGRGPHPAVVLITGSGAQNRDENIFGFKIFRIIADSLTRRGVAVLRFDDRGVGGSTGDFAASTTADFAEDARAAVSLLRSHADIDPKRIGLCGHSEGGIVASMLAAQPGQAAFIVLLACPAVRGDTLINSQIERLSRDGGAGADQIAHTLGVQEMVYAAVRSDSGWQTVRAQMMKDAEASIAQMSDEARRNTPGIDSLARVAVDRRLAAARSPWFRWFIDCNPSDTLARVHCPVLALFGALDAQVIPALNRAPMEAALRKGGNRDITVRVIPGANHLFQSAVTGNPMEYSTLKKEFVGGLLDSISEWVVVRAGLGKTSAE